MLKVKALKRVDEPKSGPYLCARVRHRSTFEDTRIPLGGEGRRRAVDLYPGETVDDLEMARHLIRDNPRGFEVLRTVPLRDVGEDELRRDESAAKRAIASMAADYHAERQRMAERTAAQEAELQRKIEQAHACEARLVAYGLEPDAPWPQIAPMFAVIPGFTVDYQGGSK